MEKKNVSLFSRCAVIVLIALLFGFTANSLNAQVRDLKSEILVYILPDSLEFPANESGEVSPEQVAVHSKALQNAFGQVRVQAIAKAFPNISDSDTVRIREDGMRVKIPQVSRIFRVRLLNEADVDLAIEKLSKLPCVLFAEKHSDMKLYIDDPRYPEQWHLNNTGQTGGTVDADIDAPEAWSIFTGSSSVKLGVIDTGVETSHDDLTGKSSGDLPESYPYDGYAHGTHVAGIAAAKHGGGDVRGVDANVQVLSRKVFSSYVYDSYQGRDVPKWAGDDNAYNKIVNAVDNGAHVLNNSYGGEDYSTTLRFAFTYAYKMNRVSVVAMGNEDTSDPRYPAAFGQGIIAVGATNHNDVRWTYSNTGNHIDVAAPGASILSTWRGNDYKKATGTSMAAPIVSGIATLLKGYNPNLYNDDIEQIIRIAVDDITTPPATSGWDQYTGTGRVNAKKALDLISSPDTVNHWTASGGSSVGNTDYYTMIFHCTPGLAPGVYIVKRYDVRKTVTFPQVFESTPYVWGRGVATNGYSITNENFDMGWCGVVPGSVTSTGVTLQTYVYIVYDYVYLIPIGWYPTSPSNVTFAYTALGILGEPPPAPQNLTITNAGCIRQHPHLSWDASSGADSYKVYRKTEYGSWSVIETTSNTSYTDHDVIIQNPRYADDKYYYKVTAVNAYGESDPSNIVSTWGEFLGKPASDSDDVTPEPGELPKEFALSQNYPNPGNPTTTIRFQLPEASRVVLRIFNIMGHEIKTLINDSREAGTYAVVWNGRDRRGLEVPSGIYFYTLEVGKRVFKRKLTLLK